MNKLVYSIIKDCLKQEYKLLCSVCQKEESVWSECKSGATNEFIFRGWSLTDTKDLFANPLCPECDPNTY